MATVGIKGLSDLLIAIELQ